MRAREQDGVPDFEESDRRGVPGAADHQLGRHRVGGPAGGPVGRGTPVGKYQSHRGSAPRLPRIQGQSEFGISLQNISYVFGILSQFMILFVIRILFISYSDFHFSTYFSSIKVLNEIGRYFTI